MDPLSTILLGICVGLFPFAYAASDSSGEGGHPLYLLLLFLLIGFFWVRSGDREDS